MTNISDAMDKAGFEIVSEKSPELIEAIRAAIQDGINAKQIEAQLIKTYQSQSDTANLAVHAAYYLQSNLTTNLGIVKKEKEND